MVTDQFFIDLKQKFIDTLMKYNQDKSLENKRWDFKSGDAEVNVSRGKIFEKACVTTICTMVTLPGRDYQSKIQWLGIQTFPANQHVPMLIGGFEHISEKGEEHYPGYFDLCSSITYDEDKEYIKREITAVAENHDKSYQELVDRYQKIFSARELSTGIGSGGGVAFDEEEQNYEFTRGVALALYRTYFKIVDKRKNMIILPEQSEVMFKKRADWVRYIFMEDAFFLGGIKLGIPTECFMLHLLPPMVKF